MFGNRRWSWWKRWIFRLCIWIGAPIGLLLIAIIMFFICLIAIPILVGYFVSDSSYFNNFLSITGFVFINCGSKETICTNVYLCDCCFHSCCIVTICVLHHSCNNNSSRTMLCLCFYTDPFASNFYRRNT